MNKAISSKELMTAIGEGRDLLELLLMAGRCRDINGQDNDSGWTPLTMAVNYDHDELALHLIKKGADVNARGKGGGTALSFSVGKYDRRLLWAVIAAGAELENRDNQGNTPLILAAMWGHEDTVAELLAAGADANARDRQGASALDWASAAGDCEMTRALVDGGADINAVGWFGRRPLYNVIKKNAQDSFELLVKAGADVRIRDKQGRTLLHHAVLEGGNHEIMSLLIDTGVGVDAADLNGLTPLHVAVQQGHLKEYHPVRTLLRRGADPEIRDRWGCSARLTAAVLGCGDSIGLVAGWQEASRVDDEMGCAISEGWQQLQGFHKSGTREYGHLKSLQLLLLSGVPAEAIVPLLRRAYAIKPSWLLPQERRQMLAELLQSGISPGVTDEKGDTLLHAVCRSASSAEDIRVVLDAGGSAAVNGRNGDGDTPLHVYLKSDRKPSMAGLDCLLTAGADPMILDCVGMDAATIADVRREKGKFSESELKKFLCLAGIATGERESAGRPARPRETHQRLGVA